MMCFHFGMLVIDLLFVLGLVSQQAGQKAGGMLKVTIRQADSAETWELEGKLSGDWVKELERCWKDRSSAAGVPLQVHLKTGRYIYAAGRQLREEMHGGGV
jgi:hypothetical protein